MKTNLKNILFVAGHSGGHIIPCATQAKKEKDNLGCKLSFITTQNILDKQIVNNFKFIDQVYYLPMTNIPSNPLKLIKFLWNFVTSFIKSLFILKKIKPSKVTSMGGIISIPVCLAAKLYFIPVEVWELNVEPGKAVKFLAKFFKNINVCFEETKKYFPKNNCILVSYPIRFNDSCRQISKELVLQQKNFCKNKKTILIIGGSQGSLYINNMFKEFILKNLDLSNTVQVIHQTGNTDFDWNNFYNKNNVKAITFNFYENMNEYYSLADLIICRSGAGTLTEIEFFQKKCITIPLQTKTTSHQMLNAKSFAKKNSHFKVINQNENFEEIYKQIKDSINL